MPLLKTSKKCISVEMTRVVYGFEMWSTTLGFLFSKMCGKQEGGGMPPCFARCGEITRVRVEC